MVCKMAGNYPDNYDWDDQEIVDLEFHDIVMSELLETDVQADRNGRSFVEKIRQTLFPIHTQTFFIAIPPLDFDFEVLYIEDDDDAI